MTLLTAVLRSSRFANIANQLALSLPRCDIACWMYVSVFGTFRSKPFNSLILVHCLTGFGGSGFDTAASDEVALKTLVVDMVALDWRESM
jgi:hypothetical protein